jgi:hypothetical protein
VSQAPDEDARQAIQALIETALVIEERVEDVDTSGVTFVAVERRDEFTYEVYRANSKREALAFLKSKTVKWKLYYIEVETPEGTYGKDINGTYEV